MTIASLRVEMTGDIPVAIVTGEVDIVNAGEIGGQLFNAAANSAPGLVVDLSAVTYLDSRGVHLLLDLANRLRMRHQELHLVVPTGALIRRVLLITHVESVIPLHEATDEAITALRASP